MNAALDRRLASALASLPAVPLALFHLFCGDPDRTLEGVCIPKVTFVRPQGRRVEVDLMCYASKGRFDRKVASAMMRWMRRVAKEHEVPCDRSDGMYY